MSIANESEKNLKLLGRLLLAASIIPTSILKYCFPTQPRTSTRPLLSPSKGNEFWRETSRVQNNNLLVSGKLYVGHPAERQASEEKNKILS